MKLSMRFISGVLYFAFNLPAQAQSNYDARLDLKVTCNLVGTDLGRLAKNIGEQTKVRIDVHHDISDEKLDVFVKDYALARLQSDVSRIFHYRWATHTTSGGTLTYVLYRDVKTRLAQESIRRRSREVERSKWKSKIAEIRRLLNVPKEDLSKLPSDQHSLMNLARFDDMKTTYDLFTQLPDSELDQLFDQGRLKKHFASDSPISKGDLIHSIFGSNPQMDVFRNAPSADFLISRRWSPEMPFSPDVVWMQLKGDEGAVVTRPCFLTPASQRYDAPPADADLLALCMKDFHQSNLKTGLDDKRLDKLVRTPPPVPGSKGGVDGVSFHTGLQRIAAATGIPIVSDYYTTGEMRIKFYEQKAYNLLNVLCTRFGQQFAWNGTTLVFRNNNWPDLMTQEVFLDTLEAIANVGGKGEANYPQSLIIAGLPMEKSQNLKFYGYSVRWLPSEWQTLLFQFLSTLSAEQQNQLVTENGLEPDTLSAGSQAAFNAFCEEKWKDSDSIPTVETVSLLCRPLMAGSEPLNEGLEFSFQYASENPPAPEIFKLIVGPDGAWKAHPPKNASLNTDLGFYQASPM